MKAKIIMLIVMITASIISIGCGNNAEHSYTESDDSKTIDMDSDRMIGLLQENGKNYTCIYLLI